MGLPRWCSHSPRINSYPYGHQYANEQNTYIYDINNNHEYNQYHYVQQYKNDDEYSDYNYEGAPHESSQYNIEDSTVEQDETNEGLLCEENDACTLCDNGLKEWHENQSVKIYIEEARLVKPGTKEICRALINSRHQNSESKKYLNTQVEVKLDPFGSVSIGHSSLLSNKKSCKDYNVPTVILKGIGGKTKSLTKVGILKHVLPNKSTVKRGVGGGVVKGGRGKAGVT